MSTMVERIALVLSEKGYEIDEDMFHYTPEQRPHSYNALVRAILEAMMNPTNEMQIAGCRHEHLGDIAGRYNAMIQAALKENA